MKKWFTLCMVITLLWTMVSCGGDDNSGGDDNGSNNSNAKCQNDTRDCDKDGVPRLCVNGEWIKQDACTEGQTCNRGACTPTASQDFCDANACKAETAQYKGNICVGEEGKKTCGCESKADCRDSNMECVSGECIVNECAQASTDTLCVNNVAITCDNGYEISRDDCNTSSSGKKCIDDDFLGVFHCGCESASDCPDHYTCSNYNFCVEENATGCTVEKCKAQRTSQNYAGDACVDRGHGAECGCSSNTDCASGFVCDTVYKYCEANDSCQDADCAAMDDNEYYGDVCVANAGYVNCGCNTNDDCRSGFSCNGSICNSITE